MAFMQEQELKGKVALVTGAARNMGRDFAVALATGGADVIVHYHSNGSHIDAEETARLVTEQGSRALLFQGDLSDKPTVVRLFGEILEAFGRIDIVVNNAGTIRKKPIVDYTEDDFDTVFLINTKAPFLVMQQAARHVVDGGRIINIGTSLQAAYTGLYGVYAASKAALEQLTRALSKEIGERGVTVNQVAPGAIDTPFMRAEETSETLAYIKGGSPMGRLGRVRDVAPIVAFLASEQSRWVTGQTLFVNGGFVTR